MICWQIGSLSYVNVNDVIHMFSVTMKFKHSSMMCCGTRNAHQYIMDIVTNVACLNTGSLNYVYPKLVHWTDIKRSYSHYICMYSWYHSKATTYMVNHSDLCIFNITVIHGDPFTLGWQSLGSGMGELTHLKLKTMNVIHKILIKKMTKI